MDQKGKIAKAAGIMSAATFISRVLGFMRDMIFAFYFGATGVSEVAADCPGCVMQIRGGCDKKNLRVAVMHTAERLADLLEAAETAS